MLDFSLLFLYAIHLAFSLIWLLIGAFIRIFIGNIILFDSLLSAGIAGLLFHTLWALHPALCILAGAVIFLLLFWLQNTRAGFWIIGCIMSLFWAAIFRSISLSLSGEDPVWGWSVFGLSFFTIGCLHFYARENSRAADKYN